MLLFCEIGGILPTEKRPAIQPGADDSRTNAGRDEGDRLTRPPEVGKSDINLAAGRGAIAADAQNDDRPDPEDLTSPAIGSARINVPGPMTEPVAIPQVTVQMAFPARPPLGKRVTPHTTR